MEKKKIKKEEKLNIENINEVVDLGGKILRLLYIVMIIAIVFIVTILIKELGILKFLVVFLKVLSPLFIGFIIAWLFNPAVKKMEEKGIPRVGGTLIVYAILITIILVLLRFLLPTIYTQLQELVGNLPTILGDLRDNISNIIDSFKGNGIDVSSIKYNLFNSIEKKVTNFTTSAPSTILNGMVNIFSSIATIFFGLFVGLYMLIDFEKVKKHFLKLIPIKHRFDAEVLTNNIGEEVRKVVNSTILVASMVFVGDSTLFAIVGLQAPILFGLFCGITDLIPYIGPYIGGAVAVVIGFSQSTFIGLMTLIICVIIQCIENFILQPIVMSKTMKLHPVTIIIGLLIFNNFFGIIGMIFATPCIALLKVIYEFIKNKYDLFKNN